MTAAAPRACRVEVRLSADELAQLDRVAVVYGASRSTAVRAVVALADIAADERRAAVAAAPSVDLVRLRQEVHRIGVNVNQAVRALHVAGVTNDADALADLYDGLVEALEVLGG